MKVVVFGDVHVNFKKLGKQINHAELAFSPDAYLQVGDFGVWPNQIGRIPKVDKPFYFVLGNHEHEYADYIAKHKDFPLNYHLLDDAECYIGETKVLGVGRSAYIDCLNTPKYSVIREDTLNKILDTHTRTDIILSHDCPSNIGVTSDFFNPGIEEPVGCTELDRLQKLKPKLWLFGHHHKNYVRVFKGTLYIGLDVSNRGYGVLDTETMGYRWV